MRAQARWSRARWFWGLFDQRIRSSPVAVKPGVGALDDPAGTEAGLLLECLRLFAGTANVGGEAELEASFAHLVVVDQTPPPELAEDAGPLPLLDAAVRRARGADPGRVERSTGNPCARRRGLMRRVAADDPEATSVGNLTSREIEVLGLLSDGRNQREIAQRLSISSRTVGAHIEHILPKLGVHSRAQAVAAAYRKQLIRRSR
jgi:DNA-binding CsgD family transcriptional regulator